MEQSKDEPRPGETTTTKSAVTSRTTTTIMTCTAPGDVLYPEEAPYHADIEDIQQRLEEDAKWLRSADNIEKALQFSDDRLRYWVRYRDHAESKRFFAGVRPWLMHLCTGHPEISTPPLESDPLAWTKWFADTKTAITGAGKAVESNVPAQMGETTVDPWRVPWDEKDVAYMQSGDARVQLSDGKPSASVLSKKLGDIPVHYMREPGKGCRVHIAEYRAWAQKKYPSDAERDEIATEYLADVEARKAAAKRNKYRPQ